jgi:hypothetical protein
MRPEPASDSLLLLLEEEDFEQMRQDTRKLVAENALLRKRIARLELHIITRAWMDWTLH